MSVPIYTYVYVFTFTFTVPCNIVYIAIEHPNHLNTMQKLFNQMWSASSTAADKAP